MANYKQLYGQMHGIVKRQYRLSVQEQKKLMQDIDAVLTKAFESYPSPVTADDKIIGVADQKNISGNGKPEVTDSKKKDQERGYRWVGGERRKVKQEPVIDQNPEQQGADATLKNQFNQGR